MNELTKYIYKFASFVSFLARLGIVGLVTVVYAVTFIPTLILEFYYVVIGMTYASFVLKEDQVKELYKNSLVVFSGVYFLRDCLAWLIAEPKKSKYIEYMNGYLPKTFNKKNRGQFSNRYSPSQTQDRDTLIALTPLAVTAFWLILYFSVLEDGAIEPDGFSLLLLFGTIIFPGPWIYNQIFRWELFNSDESAL